MGFQFNGYVGIRRGLFEHLYDGRLTPGEFLVLTLLIGLADHRTGCFITNATGLVYLSGGQLDIQNTRQCVRTLEAKGYIRRPFFEQGQRGNQRIFIDKFVVNLSTDTKLILKTLSFADTTDWEHPCYLDKSENQRDNQSEDQCEDQRDNQCSNNKLKTDNQESKTEIAATTTQDTRATSSLGGEGSVVGKTQNQSPSAQLPYNLLSAEEKAKQAKLIVDGRTLQSSWFNLVRTASAEGKITNVTSFEWLTPPLKDVKALLTSTQESVEQILAVANWGIEVSSHWFTDNKNGQGKISDFAGFARAYIPMLKQYHKYNQKAEGATV